MENRVVKALGKTCVGWWGGRRLEGRWKGCSKGFQHWKGVLGGCQKGAERGVPSFEGSAGRVRWKTVLAQEGGVPPLSFLSGNC